jgi:uncharacterized protein involved in exopolysaccharide biosynthesis
MNDSYSHSREDQDRYPDEISLVDLAVTFIRRRNLFYAVFLISTLGGLAYAFLAPTKYEYNYVSLVQVAQKATAASLQNDEAFTATLQSPAVTVATLQESWLPQVKERYYTKNKKNMPFGVVFENPENIPLIRLSTITSVQQDLEVQEVHATLIQQLIQYQDNLVKWEQASINQRIESLEVLQASLMKQENSGVALSTAIEKKLELQTALQSLSGVEVIVSARQSITKTGPKRGLIVALALVLGLMLGIFMAFMAEFGASVRKQLATVKDR